MVAAHDGVTITEQLSLDEMPIARQHPSSLAERPFDQLLIGDRVLVGGIIAQHPKPPSKSSEHRISDEYVWGRCRGREDRWSHALTHDGVSELRWMADGLQLHFQSAR